MYLEQIVFIKFLEDAAFQLDEIVGHHDGQQSLVAGVDGHVEGCGLQEEQHGVEEDVAHGQQDMRNDPDVISLLPPGLRGGPEESVNGVLACRENSQNTERARERERERDFNNLPNAEKSLSATSIMLYMR